MASIIDAFFVIIPCNPRMCSLWQSLQGLPIRFLSHGSGLLSRKQKRRTAFSFADPCLLLPIGFMHCYCIGRNPSERLRE